MSEEKDLWELVRQKISDSETTVEIKMPKVMAEEKIIEENTDEEPEVEIEKEARKDIEERRQEKMEKNEQTKRSVSYTHLTLPTKA